MSTQKYPKTILEAVYLAGKSMLEWIGTAGGLATLDANSRLAQVPYSNPVEGYLNLTLLATANAMIAIANALPAGTFRFYLVGDNSGGSSAGTIIMNTTVALLFGSASLGANTGDLIMISNIAGTKSYKLIPLGNANAPSGGFPGNSGVFSVADKVTLDKLFPVTRKAVITVIGINRVYDSSGNQENNTYEDLSPVLGDLIVGITDTSISATAFNPAILRWDGQSFKVILSGTDCTNKCILWFSPEDGLPIPYYLDDSSLWPTALASEKSIGSYLLGDNSVTGDKIEDGTIGIGKLNDNLADALNPFYEVQINGPVYLKISALQMSTPTDDAWVSYPTTLAVWDAVKNAVTNGIPVYLVDLYPLVTNTSKYLCTVMYYQNHGREGVGSFLFQYNRSSTTINGFKLSRVGSTFSCVSF